MMDQDKKASFNWWWVIAAMVAYGFVTAMINDQKQLVEYDTTHVHNYEQTEEEPDWGLAQADGDHDSNTCWFRDSSLFNETVTIVYPDYDPEEKVAGRWNPMNNTIELMQPNGLSIEIVAHEVSHMVDTFMHRYEPLDPHYEAYMQGYWTWCVYEIMMHDIEEAREGKFRFAN